MYIYINKYNDNQLCNFTLNKSYILIQYFLLPAPSLHFSFGRLTVKNGLYEMWSNIMNTNLNLTPHVRIM